MLFPIKLQLNINRVYLLSEKTGVTLSVALKDLTEATKTTECLGIILQSAILCDAMEEHEMSLELDRGTLQAFKKLSEESHRRHSLEAFYAKDVQPHRA